MEYQLQRENPIAVFDSGVGGISVLRELIRIMPEEDFIYFGDSKNAPYGTKEKEKVRDLTIGCARKLFDQGAKGLVVACNTATSAAVRKLREMYPYIPIVGIEPALKPAALCMEHPKVLVMATPMTIHAETLGRHRACTKARLFRETAAPDAPDAAVVPLYPLVSSERSHLPGLAASFTALR